jgi:hypothetical protein
MRREVRATANRLANFDDANLRRSARAAVAAGARVSRALEILGEEAPDHLAAAGRLRLDHKQASLEELGTLAEPPLTKDAIAGRIRRLLAMADRRAFELGIEGTDAPQSLGHGGIGSGGFGGGAAGLSAASVHVASPGNAAGPVNPSEQAGPERFTGAHAGAPAAVPGLPQQSGPASSESVYPQSSELPASTVPGVVSQVGPGAMSPTGLR